MPDPLCVADRVLQVAPEFHEGDGQFIHLRRACVPLGLQGFQLRRHRPHGTFHFRLLPFQRFQRRGFPGNEGLELGNLPVQFVGLQQVPGDNIIRALLFERHLRDAHFDGIHLLLHTLDGVIEELQVDGIMFGHQHRTVVLHGLQFARQISNFLLKILDLFLPSDPPSFILAPAPAPRHAARASRFPFESDATDARKSRAHGSRNGRSLHDHDPVQKETEERGVRRIETGQIDSPAERSFDPGKTYARSDPRETVKAYEGRFPVFFFLQECNPAFRFFRRLDDDKVGRITERGFDRRAEFLVCVNGIGNSHVP